MKKTFFILAILFSTVMGGQNYLSTWGDQGNGTYINPILNIDYSDPDVIRVGEKYYMIASDFHFMGMQVLESEDMVNWEIICQMFDRMDFREYDENKRYGRGYWAPSLRYHDGKFWMYVCSPDEGLFMSTAQNPAGPWTPLHLVKAVSGWEDPCPFWDEDGTAYLGHSVLGAGPIIIHKMSADGKALLDEGRTVYYNSGAEGTKIHKWNGYYYLSIPEGGTGTGWQTVLRSHDIYGPYEAKRVLEKGSTDINGPHQGSIVDTPEGQWWFYHFQRINEKNGRVFHLQPMHWKDGWPVIGIDLDGNGIGEPVRCWTMPFDSNGPHYTETSDDFSGPSLGLQWQFSHNPVPEAWSLSGGKLVLDALRAEDFYAARNTLTQKTVGYKSEATVKLELSEVSDGMMCGLAGIGKQDRILGVRVEGKERFLNVGMATESQDVIKLKKSQKSVFLRLTIDMNAQMQYQFSYSLDGKTFVSVGEPFVLRFANWKGPRVGLYCFNTRQDGGKAVFDDFTYTHDGPQAKAR